MRAPKPLYRATLPPLEPKLEQKPKTGAFELTPLTRDEEVEERTRLIKGKNGVWLRTIIEPKPEKEAFELSRCTFGLPRWKKPKAKVDSMNTTRDRRIAATVMRGRQENSLRPDPLLCSTPDPTMRFFASSDLGHPSVRKEHIESFLRKGVHITDVQDSTFLPGDSPFLPVLKKEEEEEHDESYVNFYRARRNSDDSDRGREPEKVNMIPGHGLDKLLQGAIQGSTRQSKASAAMVDKAIQRESSKKKNKTKGVSSSGGYGKLARKSSMSFADAALAHKPLIGRDVGSDPNLDHMSHVLHASAAHPHYCSKRLSTHTTSPRNGAEHVPGVGLSPCPQCNIVEGLLDNFEVKWHALSERRRQEHFLRKHGQY